MKETDAWLDKSCRFYGHLVCEPIVFKVDYARFESQRETFSFPVTLFFRLEIINQFHRNLELAIK
jgi:hypothetical protein